MWTTILEWLKDYGTWALEIVRDHGKKSVVVILLITSVILTVAYVVDNKIKTAVPEAIEQNTEIQNEEHALKLIESQEIYISIKRKLRNIIKTTGCQYIYLIEYHNGNENSGSKFPFCKFDVTMDVYGDGVPYIDINALKDEHIYKYDIFDNPEFTENQFAYCNIEQFKNIDQKLYQMALQNPNINYIYTYNLYYDGDLLGACMLLSYDKLDVKDVINNMHEVERLFNKQ